MQGIIKTCRVCKFTPDKFPKQISWLHFILHFRATEYAIKNSAVINHVVTNTNNKSSSCQKLYTFQSLISGDIFQLVDK